MGLKKSKATAFRFAGRGLFRPNNGSLVTGNGGLSELLRGGAKVFEASAAELLLGGLFSGRSEAGNH